MHYADELGVPNIVNQINKLAETDPVAWKLSDVLKHCERTGTKLSEYHQTVVTVKSPFRHHQLRFDQSAGRIRTYRTKIPDWRWCSILFEYLRQL